MINSVVSTADGLQIHQYLQIRISLIILPMAMPLQWCIKKPGIQTVLQLKSN
jgi:hypothetical protein